MIDTIITFYFVLLGMFFVRSLVIFNFSLSFVRENLDNIKILEKSYLKIFFDPFIWTKKQLKKSLQA